MRSVYGPRWCLFGGRYGNDLIAKNRAGYPTCNLYQIDSLMYLQGMTGVVY